MRGKRRERLVTEARQRLHTQAAGAATCPATSWPRSPTSSTSGRSPSASPAASPPTSVAPSCLSDPERLAAILGDPARPVQVLVAGKAHPRDDAGKQVIREVAAFTRDPLLRRRLVFLEDYDTAVARVPCRAATCGSTRPAGPTRPAARRA